MDLSGLNPQQRQAVTDSLHANTVLVAGAGSGKTRVIQARTGYLLDDMGVTPDQMMVFTFTNKASNEIKHRLAHVCPDLNKMWLGTFHGVCVRILRKFGKEMGISSFTIMDTYDAKSAIKEVMDSMLIPIEKSTVNMYLGRISRCKNNLVTPSKTLAIAKSDEDLRFAKLYQDYQNLTWKRKTFDFDDLICYTVVLLARYDHVKQWFWDNIKYIMVDESQDTNAAQFQLIKLLVGFNNLFMVGDDYQSIYAFRNANPEYLLNFKMIYPNAQILYLEQNYRSTRTIVEASSALIKKNSKQYNKNTFSQKAVGDPIIYHTARDNAEEANWVAAEIQLLNGGGLDYSKMAILYRTNSQSRAIEEAFLKFGIPYKMVNSIGFYDRKEIKDIVAYMRVAANPMDDIALRRMLGMQRGFGKKTIDEFMALLSANGNDILKTLVQFPSGKRIGSGIEKMIEFFRDIPEKPSEIVDRILNSTGMLYEYIAQASVDSQTRVENIHELMAIIKEMEIQNPLMTIEDFLTQVSLATDVGKVEETEAVTMMTIHSSKGLEFNTVFLVGAEECILPHANSMTLQADLEEERRLCYVAMTRAEEQLYITNVVARRDYNGNMNFNKPSRFINEIPDKYLLTV